MSGFDAFKTASVKYYDSVLQVTKTLHKIILHLIPQYSTIDYDLLLNDLQYSEELLMNLGSQLQLASKRLSRFEPSETQEMKDFVLEVCDYFKNDVIEMAILTIETVLVGPSGESKIPFKLETVTKMRDVLNEAQSCYSNGEILVLKGKIGELNAIILLLKEEIER